MPSGAGRIGVRHKTQAPSISAAARILSALSLIHICKAGLTDIPHQYIYSSFQEYLNQKSYILHPKAIQLYRQHFGSEKAFREFHQGNSLNSFLDTQEDLFRQQTEVARMLLRHVTEEEKIPSEENI